MNDSYPQHKEHFEVVLLKKGVSSLDAKPEDFKRIQVEATSTLAAQIDDSVSAEQEYVAMFVTKPGVPTDPETMARRRALEGPPRDWSKV